MTWESTRADQVEEISIQKNDSTFYKKWDIIEDRNFKSWIVWEVRNESNSLRVARFPLRKKYDDNTFVNLNLDEKHISEELIFKIYRTKKEV